MSGNSSFVVADESTTTRRARNSSHLTSRVWDHFELVVQRRKLGSSEETYKAVCNKCGQLMSFDPKQATTTHLLRHIQRNICSSRASRPRQQQQQEDEVAVVAPAADANDDSQAAAEAFADGVWANGDDDA